MSYKTREARNAYSKAWRKRNPGYHSEYWQLIGKALHRKFSVKKRKAQPVTT